MTRSHRGRAISTLRSALPPSTTIISASRSCSGEPARSASNVAPIAPSSLSIGTITESFNSSLMELDAGYWGVGGRRVANVNLAAPKLETAFLVKPNCQRVDAMLFGVNPRRQRNFVVVLVNRHNRLHDYRPVVDSLGHEKHGTA